MPTFLEKLQSNVISYHTALRRGYQPHNYSHHKDDIPTGEYDATLDLMIWSKDISGIDCYFRIRQTGQKIRLTVPRNGNDYRLGDTNILVLTISYTFRIQVSLDGNGSPCLDKFGTSRFG